MKKKFELPEGLIKQSGETHLIVTLKPTNFVTVDGDIKIAIHQIDGSQIKISIVAPDIVEIVRSDAKRAFHKNE